MGGFFRRLFHIYPGEEKWAILFASLAFFWSFAISSAARFGDVLFVIQVGATQLPNAYLLTALGLLIAASILLYSLHVFNPNQIFLFVILFCGAFYASISLILFMGLGANSTWFWFLLEVLGNLLFSIVITCFWTFVDQYYHMQDGKRLFTLFSTAIFIGFIGTGSLMRMGLFDLQTLLFFLPCLFLISCGLIFYISRKATSVYDDTFLEDHESRAGMESLKHLVKSILTSRFTLFLLIGDFTMQLLSVVTEYSYMTSFQNYFQAKHMDNPSLAIDTELPLFLGQNLAFVSTGNMIFGLFIYSRLVRRFGVNNLVFITPILLVFTFTGWLLNDSLLFPILGFIVVEGTMYAIDESNFTLMLNAVPSKLKPKIRVTIESFFEPISLFFSALLLVLAPFNSKFLGLGLLFFAITMMLAVRSEYLNALFRNLVDNSIRFHRTTKDWIVRIKNKDRKAAELHLLAILKLGDEKAQLFACEGLIAYEDHNLLEKILHAADEFTPNAKIKFIELISHSTFAIDNRVLDHFHAWLRDDYDIRLNYSLQFYLAKQGLLHPEKAITNLESEDSLAEGAAIIALQKSWAFQEATTAAYYRTIAAQHLEKMLNSPNETDVCMGLTVLGIESLSNNVEVLLPFLKHANLKVARTAANSIAQIIDKKCFRHAPLIISQLNASKDNEFRLSCLKALGKIADSILVKDIISASIHFRSNERRLTESIIFKMGLRTVPVLLAITKDTTMHDRCRMLAGRILGKLAPPQLRANLYDIISEEIERAYFYFYHHHDVQKQYPELKILKDALLNGFHSVIDFIIQLLGAAGSIEDSELLSRSLRSHNQKMRAQAVETLEKACHNKIFRLILPLVSEWPVEEKIRAYLKGYRKPLSLTDLLDRMEKSASQADRIVAATLKCHINIPEWRESLRQQMISNEKLFVHFGYELLET
jgi:HEAT repeat protein